MCVENISHSIIKVEEGGKKAIFSNPAKSQYQRIRVDGCVINDGPRCDYLVNELGSGSAFIELKGNGVEHACKQLFASAAHKNIKVHLQPKLGFVVVCARYPKFDSYVAKAKNHAARHFNTGFRLYCKVADVTVAEVTSL